jgi:hypothetical protein
MLGRGEGSQSGAGSGMLTTSGVGASDGVGGRTTSGSGIGIGSFAIAPHTCRMRGNAVGDLLFRNKLPRSLTRIAFESLLHAQGPVIRA